MKKVLKDIAWGLGVVVVLVALGLGYLFMRYPDVGPVPDLTATAMPDRLARGAYLANHVSVCIDCHSTTVTPVKNKVEKYTEATK